MWNPHDDVYKEVLTMVTAVKRKGKSCCGKGVKFYCDICGSSWDNLDLATECETSCEEAIRSIDSSTSP